MSFTSINPYNNRLLSTYPADSPEAVSSRISKSVVAFSHWRQQDISDRCSALEVVLQRLEEEETALARMMTQEMGKLLTEAVAEVRKCRWLIRYYLERSPEFLSDQHVDAGYARSYVAFQPLGPILCIMPWNFPLWQVFRFAVPALLAGNSVLLKHASNVQGCARSIANLFDHSCFPDGLFTLLAVPGSEMSSVIGHRSIRGISLTGSTVAGRKVAAEAGRALKKCVLELGGSDPYIILEDADIELAVKACAAGRLLNAGQSCIGAKRFIVVGSVHDQFVDHCAQTFEQMNMGDPMMSGTTLAPMASMALRDELHAQVTGSIGNGAYCIVGGQLPDLEGAFYPATLLTDVQPGMPAYDEELFGPAAAVIRAADTEDAVRIANNSMFGLGAAVFSRDAARAEKIARDHLEAGCVFVNDFVKSDPRLPFGGVKDSGYGRELSVFGIHEFCNVKSVVVA